MEGKRTPPLAPTSLPGNNRILNEVVFRWWEGSREHLRWKGLPAVGCASVRPLGASGEHLHPRGAEPTGGGPAAPPEASGKQTERQRDTRAELLMTPPSSPPLRFQQSLGRTPSPGQGKAVESRDSHFPQQRRG